MSEMIERVADAISQALAGDDRDSPDYAALARAAIAAMLEPTAGMVAAVTEGTTAYDIMPPPAAIWRAMIETALTQESN